MRITSGGNVGIGVTAPTELLHLRNAVGPSILMDDASGRSTVFRNVSTTTGAAIGTVSNHEFLFLTYNTERARFTSGGELLINTTSDAGDYKLQVNGNTLLRGGTFFQGESGPAGDSIGQRIVGTITAGASGVAKKIIYCDHTNAITVKVIAYQNTLNNGSIVQSFTTSYGATTAGTATTSYVNNITGISLAYNNGGSPAYSIDCTVNYTGSAPTLYIIVEGVARSNMYLI